MDDRLLEIAADVVKTEAEGLSQTAAAFGDPGSPLSQGFLGACRAIKERSGRVIVSGMGKSGHIARKIAATLVSTGTPAIFLHPAEASHGDLGMVSEGDVVLALSNSGETKELGDLIGYCGRFDITLVALTQHPASTLGKAADIVLPLPSAREACGETGAPTTSTTVALAVGDALAVTLLTARGFSRDDFHVYHPGGKLGAALKRVRDLMHDGRQLPLVPVGTGMDVALKTLSGGGFGCVGVTEGKALIGIITDGDVRRHLGPSLMTLPVEKVMTKGPKTVTAETLAAEALGLLARTRITALFVIDEKGVPVGLLHVHDCLSTGVM